MVDVLSQKATGEPDLMAITSSVIFPLDDLYREIDGDAFIQKIIKQIHDQDKPSTGFQVVQGHLYYKGRLVIPQKSLFIPQLLH